MPPITLAATGHRPNKLGGHNTVTEKRLLLTARSILRVIKQDQEIKAVISGMALGWDTAIALASLELALPLICAIPCPDQPSRWPVQSIAQWKQIKDQASEVHIISQVYSPECMQARNVWMVDRADHIIALYKGSAGGTRNCLQYAKRVGKPVTNLWDQFQRETL